MRLLKVVLHGYKRFADRQVLRLDTKLVALVGPNESGKSSILDALTHLSSPGGFKEKEGEREVSYRGQFPDNHEIVSGLFALEENDRAAISGIDVSARVHHIWFGKLKNGAQFSRLAPGSRLLDTSVGAGYRSQAIALCRAQLGARGDGDKTGRGLPSKQREELEAVLAALAAEEALSSKQIVETLRLCQRLFNETKVESLSALVEHVTGLKNAVEEAEIAEAHVAEVLRSRLPLFRKLQTQDRELKSSYTIHQPQPKGKPPVYFPDKNQALTNLATAAGQSLESLGELIAGGRRADAENWAAKASRILTDVVSKGWNQSTVTFRLSVDGNQLRVMVGPTEDWTTVAERSDGMRQFIALASFLKSQGSPDQDVILLIDEAEQHLHYDAQAGLVEMLSRQTLARKVIYSTHSAGCLPEDLGTSLRAVEPDHATGTSVIHTTIWHDGKLGFMPLHMALGASTFAFSAVRKAVFVEGNSDCALVPSLLREAVGADALGFSVTPGLSQASVMDGSLLKSEAHRTAYLLDGDTAGRELEKKLVESGIRKVDIFHLPKGHVVEDLVDESVYLAAVNKVLEEQFGPGASISGNDVSSVNRPRALANYCRATFGKDAPSKSQVAAAIIELRTSDEAQSLLDKKRKRALRALFRRMQGRLLRE